MQPLAPPIVDSPPRATGLPVVSGGGVRLVAEGGPYDGRMFNLPPSYVLIHRVSTAGIGVLCQLECEGPFRAEVIRWVPG